MKYILILVWIGFIAIVAKSFKLQRGELVLGKPQLRYPMWFAILMFVPIIWMAGHRFDIGDTYTYVFSFTNMPTTFGEISNYLSHINKDKGFYLFSCLFRIVCGDLEFSSLKILYLSLIAIIHSVPLILVYRKYSSNYVFSVSLFVLSTDYVMWMCNGMRQFIAVTIVFSATTLILKKKYISLILIILLASTFHQSALIMIPIIFIAQGKAWNKKTLLFLILVIISVTYIGEFTDLMNDTLENTQYSNVIDEYTTFKDDGTNPIRVLIYSMPAILSFFCRKQVTESKNPVINLCTNMSIISMGIYIISMFTSGIYIGRLPIYVSLYGYILLPWEIDTLCIGKNKKVIYMFIVAFYLLFCIYQLNSWSWMVKLW